MHSASTTATMQRDIAHHTLVRLLPQVDAGEFANIGVLLACPKQGCFESRLIKRYERVTRIEVTHAANSERMPEFAQARVAAV